MSDDDEFPWPDWDPFIIPGVPRPPSRPSVPLPEPPPGCRVELRGGGLVPLLPYIVCETTESGTLVELPTNLAPTTPQPTPPPTRVPPTPTPPPTSVPSVPDVVPPSGPSVPAPSTTRPTMPRAPVSVPGLLIDLWRELWEQYMNPQPIPWPSRRERGVPQPPRAPTDDESTEPGDLENICENYPELCRAPSRPIPGVFIPQPVDDPVGLPVEIPTRTRPIPIPRDAPSDFPYGVPGAFPNPYDFPMPAPATTPGRAPARRVLPDEPRFPWPRELLPRRRTPPQPGTRPRTRAPQQPAPYNPLIPQLDPRARDPISLSQPIDNIYRPLELQPMPSTPGNPSDPCKGTQAEDKRAQRERRKKCKKFVTKTIRVCADQRSK